MDDLDKIVEDNFNVSMWMFSPKRTAEELEQFALTGSIPKKRDTNLRKYIPDTPQQDGINFPAYPVEGDKFLDGRTGGYYVRMGSQWKKIANTPVPRPQEPVGFTDQALSQTVMGRLRSLVADEVSEHKIPRFSSKLEEKKWCAEKVSKCLGCNITVSEESGIGTICVEAEGSARVTNHVIENWGWHEKSMEEFKIHLVKVWGFSVSGEEKERVFYRLIDEGVEELRSHLLDRKKL